MAQNSPTFLVRLERGDSALSCGGHQVRQGCHLFADVER
jgi:hypothetical protein